MQPSKRTVYKQVLHLRLSGRAVNMAKESQVCKRAGAIGNALLNAAIALLLPKTATILRSVNKHMRELQMIYLCQYADHDQPPFLATTIRECTKHLELLSGGTFADIKQQAPDCIKIEWKGSADEEFSVYCYATDEVNGSKAEFKKIIKT